MRIRNRYVEFDSLERIALLSSVHTAIGLESQAGRAAANKVPRYVEAVYALAKAHGSHVSEQVIAVPGSFTEYEITFQTRRNSYTTDIVIPARPTLGPQPG